MVSTTGYQKIEMDWITPVSISFLFGLMMMLLLKTRGFWKNSSQLRPPGPWPLPLVGNLLIMDQKRPFRSMLKLSKQYGPVFRLQMGIQKIVVLTGYETVKEALVNQADAFAERPFIQLIEEFSNGFGITVSHGENWKVMRRFALTTLRDYGMGKRSIEDKIYWDLSIRSFLPFPFFQLCNMFPALGFLFGARKTLLKNRDELHAFITATFIDHLKDLDKNDQRSFIDTFLIQQQEVTKSFFKEHTIALDSKDSFVPPEKVQAEIDGVVGTAQPRTEHRIRMPYTDAVVHEVQRFADIVPTNLPHATTTDVTLKGYFIPKGTHVIPLLTSVLHDESQWEKPHEFYPEHFLNSAGKFVKRDAFMPFSAGRRICAGETLAKMEFFLFFTSLLQRFTFQPPPGTSREDLDLTRAIGLTTPPLPFHICALPR
nr:cytochrome P450 2K1-like [Pogona vitticeps]